MHKGIPYRCRTQHTYTYDIHIYVYGHFETVLIEHKFPLRAHEGLDDQTGQKSIECSPILCRKCHTFCLRGVTDVARTCGAVLERKRVYQ